MLETLLMRGFLYYSIALSGGGSTTVAPVHDGYVLQKAVATSPIGGEFLTDCLMKSLESKGIVMKPRYSFRIKEIRPGEFQVIKSINKCDVDIRRELFSSILGNKVFGIQQDKANENYRK
ncbi:actin-related protein 4-like [Cicer arietinum]|uniref:Actin-related protein 4-like n=1 Tax=Cicer arietinum TaxID=3827 RepID=A0A1S3EJV4_CICAR|nr:actin-related protein 4-like [Cicer arietinum]